MAKDQLPIYQIQDFKAKTQQEQYFYVSDLATHLQEHLFTQKPHKHNFYIILFITQGTGTHTIDFQKYDVHSGQAFFLKPGQVHSWELSEDADGTVVFFTSEFYLQEFPHRKLYDFPFFNALLYKPILSLSEKGIAHLNPVLTALVEEYTSHNPHRNALLASYLNVLLLLLTRKFQAQENVTKTPNTNLLVLQNLEDLIEQNFRQHQPVTFYAEKLNLTSKHLNEISKNALNKTTTELIQQRLVLEAQRLLVHSEITSTQIAAELGYFDTTYFFRFFKKHTGQTPEQFRAALR